MRPRRARDAYVFAFFSATARSSPAARAPGREARRRRPMPRRDDIKKILVLGSGPIVIGQAAEFDYSGAQACKVLLEEGYEVVLVNSNPATIMTDPEFATATYIEPLLPELGHARDRARAPGRAAADARRRHRAQPRPRADRGRHARALRRRADRRRLRGDPPRRGPRRVQRRRWSGPACASARSAAVKSMREAERGAARDRPAGDRPARASRWAARAAASRAPRPSTASASPRAWPRARSARCWSRSR